MTHEPAPVQHWDRPREPWLLPGDCRRPQRRTLLLEMTTRALFPTILVFSVYLLLVGHYGPGGGFSAGLVAGLAFVLRHSAGGGSDVGTVLVVQPPALVGVGMVVAVLAALAPPAFGLPVLSTVKLAISLPVLGALETQSSLFLDIGVYLLIIGVVLDLLRSLGTGIERDLDEAGARMTINLAMAVTVGVLYAVGFYLLLSRSLMRVLIGVVVLGHGSNLLLQLAGGPPAMAPIVGQAPREAMADPLPQALALTAIVITFALTTFLLALGYRSFVLVGHDEVQDDVEDRRIGRQRGGPIGLDAGPDDDPATTDDEVEPAATGDRDPQ